MPEPTTVWMVPLQRGVAPVDVEGTLSLGRTDLVFTALGREATETIALGSVRSVKRHRISPILTIAWTDGQQDRRVGFYFAPPPPIEPIVGTRPDTVREANFPAAGKQSRRRQRRKNTLYLSTLGGELKPAIAAWTSEVRAAVAAARDLPSA
jgi:hypothetical protein